MHTCELFVPVSNNELNEVNRGVLSDLDGLLDYSRPLRQLLGFSDLSEALGISLLASFDYYLFGYRHRNGYHNCLYLPPEVANLTSLTTIGYSS